MSDAVKIALIGFGGSAFTALMALIGQVIINRNNRKKRIAENEEERKKQAIEEALKEERLESRLENIEKKLDIHNGYAEKLSDIQTDIAVIKNDIKNLYERETT